MTTFLDLFAGCGGLSSGLRQAGLKSVGEVESDQWAADTLRHNFPESRVIQDDITNLDEDVIRSFEGVEVVVGGPPCQGFSVAGASQFGVDDPRNGLVHWFLHWVCVLNPRMMVIENVPNILTRKISGETVLDVVKKKLEPLGYHVQAKILNSADYGTPQLRRRAFIVASQAEGQFRFPEPTHGESSDLFVNREPYVTVGQAISDLPDIEAGDGTDDLVPYGRTIMNSYQERMRLYSTGVTNHIAMKHTNRVVERFKVIGLGQSLKDVPLEYGQIAKLTGKTVSNPYKYNNYRLDPDKPSLAIPASFQSLFIHPFKNRNLTAREAARIMGFPDEFEFFGKRTTMSWEKNLSQYNQIGNAVCPTVATSLGRAIERGLENSRSKRDTPIPITAPPLPPTLTKISGLHRSELPTIRSIVDTSLELDLRAVGQELLGTSLGHFQRQGFSVPVSTLPAALIFASEVSCVVCSPDLRPRSCHNGEMAFLISKEDLDSLRQNEQDHGLDYHLRAILDIPHQVGHFVGEQLAELDLADLVMLTNERTGRRVRGMRVVERSARWKPAAELLKRFRDALQENVG